MRHITYTCVVIIGKEFVWAHLAKAGGEMTQALFNSFPEVIEFADNIHTVEQHLAFSDRADQIAGKQRVLNIRRLPYWMVSFHVWKSVMGLLPDYKPSPMLSPYEIADSNIADQFLGRYRQPDQAPIDVWIRAEYMVDDFLAFISQHTTVNDEDAAAVRALPRANELVYDKALDHWFTPAHIRLMYLRNPQWSAVETFAYGDNL